MSKNANSAQANEFVSNRPFDTRQFQLIDVFSLNFSCKLILFFVVVNVLGVVVVAAAVAVSSSKRASFRFNRSEWH